MEHRITILSAILATTSLFYVAVTNAQITETKLTASDGTGSDEFGRSVSLSGSHALIGAYQDASLTGSAYVFFFDGTNWMEQAKLLASDGEASDFFGSAVSLSGDDALVGAPGDDDDDGSAYVFHRQGTNWVEQAKLVPDANETGWFGNSVSISGRYAVAGAPEDGEGGIDAGAAYVFHNDGTGWQQQAKLLGEQDEHFGREVCVSDRYLFVGARKLNPTGQDLCSVYIYRHDGSDWILHTKLSHQDGPGGFGISISISGDYALIGADGFDTNWTTDGVVYVYYYDGSRWVEQATLTASDGDTEDYFGGSVSISGDYALVGADGDDDNGSRSGSAYVFHYDGSTWTEQTKLLPSDGNPVQWFGSSVSFTADHALVGAQFDDENGLNSGSAYVFSASSVCNNISQFQARCRGGGLIKARVTMADASHAGETIEISIDDVPYQVVIDPTGRGQLSQGGFNPGPHIVELTDPGQCLDPIVVTCRTSLDEMASDGWDDELISETPTETTLVGNYPNPFNPSTTIRYSLSVDSPVSIRVYNMLGQEVATLVDGFQKAGERSVVWNGVNNFGQAVASGLYIYRLQAGSTIVSQKMLFTK